MFFGFYKERKKMSKVYNYYKDKIEQDATPTMNEVDQELYLIETVKVMKEAIHLLSSGENQEGQQNECLTKLQEQITTAEETILQFEVDMEEMAKHYEKR